MVRLISVVAGVVGRRRASSGIRFICLFVCLRGRSVGCFLGSVVVVVAAAATELDPDFQEEGFAILIPLAVVQDFELGVFIMPRHGCLCSVNGFCFLSQFSVVVAVVAVVVVVVVVVDVAIALVYHRQSRTSGKGAGREEWRGGGRRVKDRSAPDACQETQLN